jgi:hypothetical protein
MMDYAMKVESEYKAQQRDRGLARRQRHEAAMSFQPAAPVAPAPRRAGRGSLLIALRTAAARFAPRRLGTRPL